METELSPLISFILVNIVTTLLLAVVSFSVGLRLLRGNNSNPESKAFGAAWLFVFPIGLLSALGSLLFWFKLNSYFLITESILQVFAAVDIIFVLYYFLVKLFGRNRINSYVVSAHLFFVLLFVYFLFEGSLTVVTFSPYGAEYVFSSQAQITFLAITVIPFLLNIYDFFLRIFRVIVSKRKEVLTKFLPALSLLFFGMAGVLDQFSLSADWPHMLIRINMLIGAGIAYFCYE